MRLRPLLAVTAVSMACFAAGCSDDDPPANTAVDTGTTDTASPADTSISVDSGDPMFDTGAPADTTTPADTNMPADTSTPADTMVSDVPLGDGGPPGSVRIHEVYIDRNLEGDVVEFIEVSGAPGTSIGTLWIRALKADGSAYWKLRVADSGAKIGASGFWVIGTAGITNVNKVYTLAQFGLDNGGGSIQLTDDAVSATTAIDTLGYGTVVAMAATDPKPTTEGTAAALPASGSTGKTIGRKTVPGDSNNNSADFCVMNATPGAANGSCLP